MFEFDRYKILSAIDALRIFTVRDLATYAMVSEGDAAQLISSLREILIHVGGVMQGGALPAPRYRLDPQQFERFQRELQSQQKSLDESAGLLYGSVADSRAGALPPLALRAAEIELYDNFPEADSQAEQWSIMERARDLLIQLKTKELSSPTVKDRQAKAEQRLKELSQLHPVPISASDAPIVHGS
jgi:hypothetical protein